jgi:NTE family protein
LFVLLALTAGATALAQPAKPEPPAAPAAARPKIGLVLSGGGARGLAHIGVLRVLEEMKVPVDLIVGTSMGAVVGGAYASGRSVDELEALVKSANWNAILADRPARDRLSIRRREDDERLPSRIEFGFNLARGAMLPGGAAGNGQLEATLSSLLPATRTDDPLRRLPIPFRAVATDLLSGAMLDQADTPLFEALRASMAVPGVFAPLRVNGRPRVDGGLVRNLPIDLARQLGADIIIAVNVGTPLLEDREITSAVMVANQMLQILTEQNVQRSLRELRPQDVIIDPDLPAWASWTSSAPTRPWPPAAVRRWPPANGWLPSPPPPKPPGCRPGAWAHPKNRPAPCPWASSSSAAPGASTPRPCAPSWPCRPAPRSAAPSWRARPSGSTAPATSIASRSTWTTARAGVTSSSS